MMSECAQEITILADDGYSKSCTVLLWQNQLVIHFQSGVRAVNLLLKKAGTSSVRGSTSTVGTTKSSRNNCTSNLLHNQTSGNGISVLLQSSTSTFGPSQQSRCSQNCRKVVGGGCGPICSSWRGLKAIRAKCVRKMQKLLISRAIAFLVIEGQL